MKQITIDILKQADEATAECIAEEFPASWEKEELFERAFRNYQEQSQERHAPAPGRRHMLQIVGAAACCILVLGAAFALQLKPHQIPTVPPVETTTVTATQATEHAGSTIAAIVETEAALTTEPLQTEATDSRTTILTETAPTVLTETVPVTVPGIADVTEPPPTEAPTMPTEPPVQETSVQTTLQQQDAPEIIQTTETEILPGFDVKHQDGELEITYLEQLIPSPDGLRSYWVHSEMFWNVSEEGAPSQESSRTYRIWMPNEDYYFFVIQTKREVFRQTCSEDALLIPADVNGHPGYYVLTSAQQQNSTCILYWDDGYYSFMIEDTVQNQEVMMLLAEEFTH